MAEINARSPLLHSRLLQFNEAVFWAITEPPVIESDDGDVIHTVTANDRIDNLAAVFYGDPRLMWVIMRANDMYLLPQDMPPGREIRIPAFSRLLSEGIVLR